MSNENSSIPMQLDEIRKRLARLEGKQPLGPVTDDDGVFVRDGDIIAALNELASLRQERDDLKKRVEELGKGLLRVPFTFPYGDAVATIDSKKLPELISQLVRNHYINTSGTKMRDVNLPPSLMKAVKSCVTITDIIPKGDDDDQA